MDDDETTRSVRRLRPDTGWARSPAGQGLLERSVRRADGIPASPSGPTRRPVVLAVAAAGGLGLTFVGLSAFGILTFGPSPVPEATGRTVTMESSFVIDVTSLPAVLAYTDTVFVGRVEAIEGQDADDGWTFATVRVIERVAGISPDVVTVRQRGYVDDNGTTHVTEAQAIVGAGRSYVFALSDEPDSDVYTVVAGPHGAVDAGPDVERLLRSYRAARR